jgi:dipeptide/tripeptide permease
LTWSMIDPHHLAARLGGAAVALAVFVWVERRHPYPMLDLALFGRPAFLGAVTAMIGYSAAGQVLVFFLPLYLQNAFGYSPIVSGGAMLPYAIPLFVMPRIGARASVRYGNRAVLVWGLACLASGNLLLAWSAPLLQYPLFGAAMVLTGVGAGLLNGETAQTLQGTIPPERGGMAGGLSATVRFTAILLAVAVLGVVLSHAAMSDFVRRAAQGALTVDVGPFVRRVIAGDAAGAVAGVPDSARAVATEIARRSVAFGIAWLMWVAGLVAAASSLVTWRLLPGGVSVGRGSLEAVLVD